MKEPWIPKEGCCKPILMHPGVRNFSVAQLLNPQGEWNEALVNDSFMDYDARAILNIPINPRVKEDEII